MTSVSEAPTIHATATKSARIYGHPRRYEYTDELISLLLERSKLRIGAQEKILHRIITRQRHSLGRTFEQLEHFWRERARRHLSRVLVARLNVRQQRRSLDFDSI